MISTRTSAHCSWILLLQYLRGTSGPKLHQCCVGLLLCCVWEICSRLWQGLSLRLAKMWCDWRTLGQQHHQRWGHVEKRRICTCEEISSFSFGKSHAGQIGGDLAFHAADIEDFGPIFCYGYRWQRIGVGCDGVSQTWGHAQGAYGVNACYAIQIPCDQNHQRDVRTPPGSSARLLGSTFLGKDLGRSHVLAGFCSGLDSNRTAAHTIGSAFSAVALEVWTTSGRRPWQANLPCQGVPDALQAQRPHHIVSAPGLMQCWRCVASELPWENSSVADSRTDDKHAWWAKKVFARSHARRQTTFGNEPKQFLLAAQHVLDESKIILDCALRSSSAASKFPLPARFPRRTDGWTCFLASQRKLGVHMRGASELWGRMSFEDKQAWRERSSKERHQILQPPEDPVPRRGAVGPADVWPGCGGKDYPLRPESMKDVSEHVKGWADAWRKRVEEGPCSPLTLPSFQDSETCKGPGCMQRLDKELQAKMEKRRKHLNRWAAMTKNKATGARRNVEPVALVFPWHEERRRTL